jgi:hypothetical protein
VKRCLGAALALAAAVVIGTAIDPLLTITHVFRPSSAPAGIAADVLREPPIIADLQTIAEIEPSLKQLQEQKAKSQQHDLRADRLSVSNPSLNRWDRIDRTAHRHKSTLDYFLGFGY